MVVRNQYYDIFTKAILDQIQHVTEAIEEFQQNPFIEWTAVEWQRPQNNDDRATSIIVYGRDKSSDVDKTIYGIVPLDVVAQDSKQAVLDFLAQVMNEGLEDDEVEGEKLDESELELVIDEPKPTIH